MLGASNNTLVVALENVVEVYKFDKVQVLQELKGIQVQPIRVWMWLLERQLKYSFNLFSELLPFISLIIQYFLSICDDI